MSTCSSGAARASVRRTHGIALPVVLMFLLIITISAVYSIRRSTLSEGITRNQLDYEIARQSAEAALRDAERDLFSSYSVKPANAACDRSTDRPLKDKLVPGLWESTCPRGQCRVSPDYLAASNYATMANAATKSTLTIVRDSLTAIGIMAYMLYLDWELTLIFVVTAPLMVLYLNKMTPKLREAGRANQGTMGEMTQVAEEASAGQRMIKIFAGAEYSMRIDQPTEFQKPQIL